MPTVQGAHGSVRGLQPDITANSWQVRALCNGVIETMGRVNYEGKIKHPFTAHPKIDPQTGESSFCVHHLLCFAAWLFSRYKPAVHSIHCGLACTYLVFIAFSSLTWSADSNVGKHLLFSFAWYNQTLVLIYAVQFVTCSICQ